MQNSKWCILVHVGFCQWINLCVCILRISPCIVGLSRNDLTIKIYNIKEQQAVVCIPVGRVSKILCYSDLLSDQ